MLPKVSNYAYLLCMELGIVMCVLTAICVHVYRLLLLSVSIEYGSAVWDCNKNQASAL